jgi:hypothetical protein
MHPVQAIDEQGHPPSVTLDLSGDFSGTYLLMYAEVTEQMRRCWNDREYATEQAAYGIALLIMQGLTNLTVVERSRRGTGFDYWLGEATALGEQPFRKAARLEVSGIRSGSEQQIRARATLKMKQVCSVNAPVPAYVAIIEFSRPLAWIVNQ